MVNPAETLFIEMAVAKGHLKRTRADEALKIQRADVEGGAEPRLIREIVLEKGWMTNQQAADVDSQIEEGSTRTGKIAGYKLLAKIGQGGMGAVYKAEREETDEVVALKILPSRMAEKGDFVERFLREARAASKIVSEHIVGPVDVGFSGGYYYIAMEFIEGESVDTTLSIDGSMAESKALRIALHMAMALRDAEKAEMVHRDIKPGNILVTADGVAKLTDFGLARETADQSMTQAGMTLGTPNYMSPEQAKAVRALDTPSDIYSLGVTFYHMVTGTVPFKGETSMLTMLKHLNEQPVAPINRRPDLSRGCNDVILQMLEKNRDLRYRRAQDLVTDLELVVAGKPPKFAKSTAPPPETEEPAEGFVPDEVERFAEEIRRQTRTKWIKLGVGLSVAAIAVIVLYNMLAGGPTTDGNGKKNGGGRPPPHSTLLEKQARAALKEAREYARKNPAKLIETAELLAAIEAKYQATKVYGEARKFAEEIRGKLGAAVNGEFKACESAAETLAQSERFGTAISAFDKFPAALRTADVIDRIDRAKKDLQRRAWVRFREQADQARKLVKMNRFTAAREIADRIVRDYGISGIVTDASQLRSEIEDAQVAAGSTQDQAAIAAYQAAVKQVRAFVRRGDFDAALAERTKQRQRAEHQLVRKTLDALLPTIITAGAVWDMVLTGVTTLQPGARMPVGTQTATFVKYDPKRKRLEFRMRGKRRIRISPGWLPATALKDLATAGSGGKVTPLQLTAFFLARGDYQQAAAQIALAKAKGDSAILIKRYRTQLDMLQKNRKEIAAENLLAKAREEAKLPAGGYEQAARTLRELITNYADTRCCGRNRKEIQTMLAKAVTQSITVETLFGVTATDAGNGRSELKYDFSDLSQDADWPSVWKQRAYGHWPTQHVYGEKTCRNGLVYFKVPLQGDYEIEVRIKDVKQASLRFGMPTPVASAAAGGLSFNWKRTRDGAETTLLRADKPLVGTRRLPRFRVVGALVLSIQIKQGQILAKVGDQVAHRASIKPPDAKAGAGYLVLDRFNAGARLTGATIRSTLDRAWLEKQFVLPLRREKLEEARWLMARYRELLKDGDTKAWRLDSRHGEWTFDQDTAAAPSGAKCEMTTGDLNWRNYSLSANVRVGGTRGGARLLVRWSDATRASGQGQGYAVDLQAGRGTLGSGGKAILLKMVKGRQVTLRQTSVDLAGFRSYRFNVEVRDNRIRVLLGPREILRAEDSDYPTGRVGVASHLCGARFNEIKVKLIK